MALPDLTGLNIEDTYQRVLHTDGVSVFDGTGSMVSLHYTGSFTGSFTGSLLGTATNAQDIIVYVKNVSGAPILKGRVVRISGATGDNALISTASYEDDPNSANTLGITRETIANDSFGYVITEGTLLGINTDQFSPGQLLYLGPTGSIIGSAPLAPLHNVRLGEALRIQQNNGSMYVRIDNGYEIGELHDVRDGSTTSSFGDLLVKSGSVWTNSKQLTGSYAITGSLQADSFTGSLLGTSSWAISASHVSLLRATGSNLAIQFNNGGFLGANSNFTYNTASNTVIIDTNLIVTDKLSTTTRRLIDSNRLISLDWENRQGLYSDGTTVVLDWNSLQLYVEDSSLSVDWGNRVLVDTFGSSSIDWKTRTLKAPDGTSTILSWNNVTGSLIGTASWATNAVTASHLTTLQSELNDVIIFNMFLQ